MDWMKMRNKKVRLTSKKRNCDFLGYFQISALDLVQDAGEMKLFKIGKELNWRTNRASLLNLILKGYLEVV